jgi:predicted ATP-dependent endonuclease of OLD family
MYLSKFRVENYKSFRDSGEIEFKPGINIIVGQNNSGKTALLEALVIGDVASKPHKSSEKPLKQYPWQNNSTEAETKAQQLPKINATIFMSPSELNALDMKFVKVPFTNYINNYTPLGLMLTSAKIALESFDTIFQKGLFVSFKSDGYGVNSERIKYSFNESEENDEIQNYKDTILTKDENKDSYSFNADNQNKTIDELGKFLGKFFCSSIYRFEAERLCAEPCLLTLSPVLDQNAENLAEVINYIHQKEHTIFEEYNKLVKRVIPTIQRVSCVQEQRHDKTGFWGRVKVWTSDKTKLTDELSFSLDDCGTGVGQVLAILYVIVTSKDTPKTIIIDEPNSFLHPTASKALLKILKENDQHQYFISTHSPEIIRASNPSTVTMLKYVGGETVAKSINTKQTEDLRKVLNEVGISFADMFFSENIFWVEGETEEDAFPLIMEKIEGFSNTAFLKVINAGDLNVSLGSNEKEKKRDQNTRLILSIYNKLTGEHALTPPFVAILFDRELRKDTEMDKMKQISDGKIQFISKRMFENYLIDSKAITEVLNEALIEATHKVKEKNVDKFLKTKQQERFLSKKEVSDEVLDYKDWLEKVHAGELLEILFTSLSKTKVEYRKRIHSVQLTKWFLANKPEQFKELQDFLVDLLKPKEQSNT